jgi:hypothetical protein
MAPARIDSVWQNTEATAVPSFGSVVEKCAEVQEQYVCEIRTRVARVALIIQRVCPVAHPAQALIQRFCNESSQREPFSRSESFEIHNHKVYVPQRKETDFPINSWVRCKSAKLATDNRPVILVEQDLNTLANEADARPFEPGPIHAFFQMAAAEADEILRIYFPG